METPGGGRYPLGVLFVHGIGSQKQGETLRQGAEAVHAHLDRWLNSRPEFERETSRVRVEFDHPVVQPQDGSPARTDLVLTGMEGNSGRMLLAESWWADLLQAPGSLELLHWSVSAIPRTVVTHMIPRYQHELTELLSIGLKGSFEPDGTWRQWLAGPSAVVLGLFLTIGLLLMVPLGALYVLVAVFADAVFRWRGQLWGRPTREARAALAHAISLILMPAEFAILAAAGFLVQLVLAALAIGALIPIEALKNAAHSAQVAVVETLGDSHRFVRSPLLERAVCAKVGSDLDWMLRACDRVVVVAHSQGAAASHSEFAHRTRRGDVPRTVRLVTLGAGISKLQMLRALATGRISAPYWISSGVALYVSGTLIWVSTAAALGGLLSGWGLVGTWLAAWAGILGALFFLWPASTRIGAPEPIGVNWHDFFASADPVPAGALLRSPTPAWPWASDTSSTVVGNLASTALDHNSYYDIHDDFVARLVNEFRSLLEVPEEHEPELAPPPDPRSDNELRSMLAKLATPEEIDQSSQRRLWRLRWLAHLRRLVWLPVIVIPLTQEDWIRSVGAELAGWMEPLGRAQWMGEIALLGRIVDHLSNNPLTLGVLGLIVAAVAVRQCLQVLWRTWDRDEISQFFERRPRRATTAAALGVRAALLLVVAASVAPVLHAWTSLGQGGTLLATALASGAVLVVLGLVEVAPPPFDVPSSVFGALDQLYMALGISNFERADRLVFDLGLNRVTLERATAGEPTVATLEDVGLDPDAIRAFLQDDVAVMSARDPDVEPFPWVRTEVAKLEVVIEEARVGAVSRRPATARETMRDPSLSSFDRRPAEVRMRLRLLADSDDVLSEFVMPHRWTFERPSQP